MDKPKLDEYIINDKLHLIENKEVLASYKKYQKTSPNDFNSYFEKNQLQERIKQLIKYLEEDSYNSDILYKHGLEYSIINIKKAFKEILKE